MKTIEKLSGIFFIAGLALFGVAVFSLAIWPVMMVERLPDKFTLPTQVPQDFQGDYDTLDKYHAGLTRGRDLYIAEGCWHCHSQYVRPTANEELRYGPVSTPQEYQNSLNLPQLFGTRRVGPDLSREGGIKSNDWHYAHLYKPTSVVPESVMPSYSWYFTEVDGVPTPTEDGKAIVAYLQWLGKEVNDRVILSESGKEAPLPPRE